MPKLATAAANLRTAGAILILRANSKNESEALIALHNVRLSVRAEAQAWVSCVVASYG